MGRYELPVKKVDPVLSPLMDSIRVGFRKRQYDALEKDRKGIWHVTDLAKSCMRNVYYSKMAGIPKVSMDSNSMSHVFVGEAVHQLLDSVNKEEYPLAIEMKFGEDSVKYEGDKDVDQKNVIYGEMDAMYEMVVNIDGETQKVDAIVDYKTWNSNGGYKKKAPNEEHVRQINYYKYMVYVSKGVEIKYGAVVYLDMYDKMAKPIIFTFPLKPIKELEEELKAKVSELIYARESGKLPARTISWLCDGFCPHIARCSREEELPKREMVLRGE